MASFGALAPGSDWQDQEAQANLLAAYPELRGAKPPPPPPALPQSQDLPDIGPPPLSPGPQVSAGQPFLNRWGNILGQAGGHLAQNVALGLPRTLWDFVKANVDASKAPAGTPEAHEAYGQLGAPTAGLAMAMMAPEAPEAGAAELGARLVRTPKAAKAAAAEAPAAAAEAPSAINWDRTSTQMGGGGIGDRKVVDVPVDAFQTAFKDTNPDQYLDMPKQRVRDHIIAGNPISLPEIYVGRQDYPPPYQQLGFVNGRNRALVAKEMGEKTIPVVVEKGSEDAFQAMMDRYKSNENAPFPQYAEQYPPVGPPTLKYKGTGKPVPASDMPTGDELERRMALPKDDDTAVFQSKQLTPEAEQFRKARLAMKPDIEAGNYVPYFDPAKRADVDPRDYGDYHDTRQNLMKTPATREQYDIAAAHPAAVARLEAAYQQGLKQKGSAENWYFMQQLQSAFIREYGPEQGRAMFKEKFADPMAATTGGADPTANYLMSQYGNFLRAHGLEVPATHQTPFPIGGQYAAKNMDQFRKMIMEGEGIDPVDNPKRYNFSGNYLGRSQQSTIDEQMSGLFFPGKETPPEGLKGAPATLFKKGMQEPPGGSYGHFERVIDALAQKHGVDPRYYQEVAWAGIKDLNTPGGFTAKPMIAHVNDAIERTHRLTGMPREEIVRRGIVRGEIPIYGGIPVGRPGAALGASTTFGTLAPTRQQQPPASANDQLPPGARMLGPARPGVGIPYDQIDPGMPVTTLGIRG